MAPRQVHAELTADGKFIFLIGAQLGTLGTLTPLFKMAKAEDGAIVTALSWPAVVQLSKLYGAAWKPGPRLAEWVQGELQRRSVQPPATFSKSVAGHEARDYQVQGAAMIASMGRALIFDSPGIGKTATTVLGLCQRAAQGFDVWPAIVMCPASVMDSWVREFGAWAPWLIVRTWRGSARTRTGMLGLPTHVYITSYDTARQDTVNVKDGSANPLLRVQAKTLVADELHLTKGQHTGRSKAMVKIGLKAEQFVGLSGTPISHHPADLWPSLNVLSPGAYPSRERWVDHFCSVVRGEYQDVILGIAPHAKGEFETATYGQTRRVSKEDVLTQLPPKVYSVREVELPAEWRKAYDDMEAQMLAEIPDFVPPSTGPVEEIPDYAWPELSSGPIKTPSGEISVMVVVAQLTRLSQLACAAADVNTWAEEAVDRETGQLAMKEHTEVTLRAPSWKVDALLEILEERPGHPTLTFAPSAQLMRLAGAAATKAGYRVGYVIGGQSARVRTENIDKFQAGELDLMCLTTAAGGVGITLTAADTIVFLQRPWSVIESIQAEDRAHRLGSEIHESIEIIDVVAKSTIDSRRREVLRERGAQLAELLRDPRVLNNLLGGDSLKHGRKKVLS